MEKLRVVLTKLFMALPFILVVLNFYWLLVYGPANYEIRLTIWQQWVIAFFFIYLFSFPILLGLFVWKLIKGGKANFLVGFIAWVLGIIAIWFTFAFSGILVDLILLVLESLKRI